MEISRTITWLAQSSRVVALAFAAATALSPALALPSQAAKELIGEACYNELQQRENLVVLCRGAPQ